MTDPAAIFNWRRFDARLTTSGQPTEAQLPLLAALGIRRIVNLALHTHEKALADEVGSVAALGLDYVHIPVAFDAPRDDDYHRFRAVMAEDPAAPLHVHCIANYRVTAFLYRYRRDHLGLDEAVARAELDSVWRPGGVWAAFIGDAARTDQPHLYAGRDYGIGRPKNNA